MADEENACGLCGHTDCKDEQCLKDLDTLNDIKSDLLTEYQYEFCQLCGLRLTDKYHICDEEILILKDRPRFYMMDLDNYIPEFLQEIIIWQDRKIKYLEKQIIKKKE
jgi:hypothetical protein